MYTQNKTLAASAIDERNRRGSVVAGGNPTPVFQASEHDLDPTASLVSPLVVFDRFVARLPPGDAGLAPPLSNRASRNKSASYLA